MQTELTHSLEVRSKAPCLVVTDADDQQTLHELIEGKNILAGSSESCAIRLPKGEANLLHCMFQFTNGNPRIQDWNTDGGTLFNGTPLDEAMDLAECDEVIIGSWRISVCLSATSEQQTEVDTDGVQSQDRLHENGEAVPRDRISSRHADDPSEKCDEQPDVWSIDRFGFQGCFSDKPNAEAKLTADGDSEPADSADQTDELPLPTIDSRMEKIDDLLAEDTSVDLIDGLKDLHDEPADPSNINESASLISELPQESTEEAFDSLPQQVDEFQTEYTGTSSSEEISETHLNDLLDSRDQLIDPWQDESFGSAKSDEASVAELDTKPFPKATVENASADLEEPGMLRQQVARLQIELEEKDSQILQLCEASQFSQSKNSVAVDEAQTEKLVARLEQLLGELEGADDKVAELENLLQAAEHANQAELEERQQLEAWVNQFEQRLLDREAETAATSENLQKRLEEERSQRGQVESQLQHALELNSAENSDDHAANSMIEELRQQNVDLETRLNASLRELESRPEHVEPDPDAVDHMLLQAMENRVRSLESELAGERADTARKAELFTRCQQEMQKRLNEVRLTKENESRMNVMKQHIRELHIEEKLEQQERFERSLGGRIAKLWQKIEGR